MDLIYYIVHDIRGAKFSRAELISITREQDVQVLLINVRPGHYLKWCSPLTFSHLISDLAINANEPIAAGTYLFWNGKCLTRGRSKMYLIIIGKTRSREVEWMVLTLWKGHIWKYSFVEVQWATSISYKKEPESCPILADCSLWVWANQFQNVW